MRSGGAGPLQVRGGARGRVFAVAPPVLQRRSSPSPPAAPPAAASSRKRAPFSPRPRAPQGVELSSWEQASAAAQLAGQSDGQQPKEEAQPEEPPPPPVAFALVSDRALCGDMLQHLVSWVPAPTLPSFRRACRGFRGAVAALLAESAEMRQALGAYVDHLLSGRGEKRVWVGVRVKPEEGSSCVWQVRNSICVAEPRFPPAEGGCCGPPSEVTPFFFDRVFGGSARQQDIWGSLNDAVMRCVLRREHCCLLAYGQTGSGKTHTMFGVPEVPHGEGVAYRAVQCLGAFLRRAAAEAERSGAGADGCPAVEFSFLEVYNEAVYDCLNCQQPVPLRAERAVLRPGGKYHAPVYSGLQHVAPRGLVRRRVDLARMEEQVHGWLQEGAATRTVGQTAFNARSSRSHAVATLHVLWPHGMQLDRSPHGRDGGVGGNGGRQAGRRSLFSFAPPPREAGQQPGSPRGGGQGQGLPGSRSTEALAAAASGGSEFRIYLVDLAGSERAGLHALSRKQLQEGVNINKSLSTLGRVVGALARGRGEHVPHRDSTLTWLLSDSITGRGARAFMIAAVHPGHCAETLSTLRYAQQYSTLQSDLSTRIPQLASDVRNQQHCVARLLRDFSAACASAANQPPEGWTRGLLSGQAVRLRQGARQRVELHPHLQWTPAHQSRWLAHEVGVVGRVLDGLPPHAELQEALGPYPAEGDLAALGEAASDATPAADRLVEVVYLGQPQGRRQAVLQWPRSALEELAAPRSLREALRRLEAAEEVLAQRQARLDEAMSCFARQQREWLTGGA